MQAAPPPTRGPWPLLRLGFRPFYLLAAAWAALAVPLWLAQYFGLIAPPAYLRGAMWHAHEMIFGFAAAVIVGFLFTAARNWTGLPTPSGYALAALALLWCAGRLLVYAGPPPLAAAVDVAFLPCAAIAVFVVLRRVDQRRNYPLPAILGLLAITNAAFHLSVQGVIDLPPHGLLVASLAGVVIVATIIGGRVIPSFTASAVRGLRPWRNTTLDIAALAASLLAFGLHLAGAPAAAVAPCAVAAALLHLARLIGWRPLASRHAALLWILHLSYAWIPVGFALLAAAALDAISPLAAYHAFGIGAVSGLILGMITRTALGHTGRLLQVGAAEIIAYILLQAAAALRVASLAGAWAWYGDALVLAGLCYSLAFLIYLAVYTPYLLRARIDGKDG